MLVVHLLESGHDQGPLDDRVHADEIPAHEDGVPIRNVNREQAGIERSVADDRTDISIIGWLRCICLRFFTDAFQEIL